MNWNLQALPQGFWSAQIDGVEIASGKEDDQTLGQCAAMLACAREIKKRHVLDRAARQDDERARKFGTG